MTERKISVDKITCSITEAAKRAGISIPRLYKITNSESCKFVLWVGLRRRIKINIFEKEYNISSLNNEIKTKIDPFWNNTMMSVPEAAAYSGVPRDRIYELTLRKNCPFVFHSGPKRLVKKKEFDEFLSKIQKI